MNNNIPDMCPYCGAKFRLSEMKPVIRCEYCDSEIIIGSAESVKAINTINNLKTAVFPQNNNSGIDAEEFDKKIKAWKKTLIPWKIAYFVLCFAFWAAIMADVFTIGGIAFIASCVIFWAKPPSLAGRRDYLGNSRIEKTNQTIKLYFSFFGVGFLALVTAGIFFG